MKIEDIEAIQALLKTPEGETLLKFINDIAMPDTVNNPTGLTPMEFSYNEGMRAVALQLRTLINTDTKRSQNERTNTDTRNQRANYFKPNGNNNSFHRTNN
ncbi:MAG: hypothetical protein U9O94_02365 [Nanoarchaeota archaeon]|nr:hypothetical protein [Nanoarchaeota archaeon]